MPYLSLSNPRSRASVVAVLLLLEFVAILWLRQSPAANDHNPDMFQADPQSRETNEQPYLLHRVVAHVQKKTRNTNTEEDARRSRIAEQRKILEERSKSTRARQEIETAKTDTPSNTAKDTSDNNGGSNKDQPEESKGRQRHHHHRLRPSASDSKPAEKIKNAAEIDSSSSNSASKTTTRTTVASTSTYSRPSTSQTQSSSTGGASGKPSKDSETKTTPSDSKKTKNEKKKSIKGKGTKDNKGKGKSEETVQKSRAERKLGQLIPAVDENGAIIEDHFISPRDSDGDGVPDYYVLLRPSTNPKFMMDVGLFDEDIVAPKPAVLSSIIIASHPTAVPVVPQTPTQPKPQAQAQAQAPANVVAPSQEVPKTPPSAAVAK
ncbi:hypothetical protein BGZ94_008657 [Podila epigama]|nr:hypothetical protein BGZ94_008657 [Podila epigama]